MEPACNWKLPPTENGSMSFSHIVYRGAPMISDEIGLHSRVALFCRPRIEGNSMWRIDPGPSTPRLLLDQFAIRRFWATILCRRPWYKFDNISECCEANYCFACGAEFPTLDAAHIVPIWAGGSNHPSNVHLLCPGCHAISECVGGLRYWRWFKWWRMGKMLRYWSGDTLIATELSRLLHRDTAST